MEGPKRARLGITEAVEQEQQELILFFRVHLKEFHGYCMEGFAVAFDRLGANNPPDLAGSLLPGDQYQLAMLIGNELVLQMEDGRCLEVTVVSNRGKLHKRGEIYKCDGSP